MKTHIRLGALLLSLSLLLVVGLPEVVSAYSGSAKVACAVNLRSVTSPASSSTILKVLYPGTTVTVAATVYGNGWSGTCGTSQYSHYWYKISAVNGTPISTLFPGHTYAYSARGYYTTGSSSVGSTSSTFTRYVACAVYVRDGTTFSYAPRRTLSVGTKVTVVSSVIGNSWTGSCPGAIAGSNWYKISAIGGTSVSSLFGVSFVYAITGYFTSTAPSSSGTSSSSYICGYPPSGNAATASAQRSICSAIGKYQYSCLYKLWTRESNWHWYALNRYSDGDPAKSPYTDAYGIPQSYGGYKMHTAGSNWITSPLTQVHWGMGYIDGRYGTSCAAWKHSQDHNWY
jgi:hypothetical protein